jgi:antitoxin (DNA-binding transcriptional repressor) of toxin-antitoxin stability system
MKTYSIEEARGKLGDIVLAATTGESTLLTYHGIPSAMVIALPFKLQFVADSDSGTATETHNR